MAYENIQSNKPAFCYANGAFVLFQPAPSNMMVVKTSHGDPIQTYPFSHEISLPIEGSTPGEFLSIQYDGINYWTLEKKPVTVGTEIDINQQRIIRRWQIENHVCVLKDSWLLAGQSGEYMNGQAFAIENYWNRLKRACGPGVTYNGTSYIDRIDLVYPHAAFFHVTDQFRLTSESTGEFLDMPVASTPSVDVVTTTQPISKVFYTGDRVNLRRHLYFFNNQSPAKGASSAAVYEYAIPYLNVDDPTVLNTPTYITCHDSGIYEGTTAATFITTSGNIGINNGIYTGVIGFLRGMQLLMKQPNMPGGGTLYPGNYSGTNQEFKSNIASMLMTNLLSTDRISIHSMYDLSTSMDTAACICSNVYGLQGAVTFGSMLINWSSYNYVAYTLKPLVTSIALTAEPALVVANGVDRSFIYATVRDQFGAPLNGKRVVLDLSASNSNGVGYFLCPESISSCVQGSFSWLDATPHKRVEIVTGSQSAYPGGPAAQQGQVVVEWRSGTVAGVVSIVATVQP